MKHIQINLPDHQLPAWKTYCKQQQKTGTKILRNFIYSCLEKSEDINHITFFENSNFLNRHKKQINLRLNDHELSALHEKSKKMGYAHPNHWIRPILEKALFEKEIYHPQEISALQDASNQLWAIGHNLNQITKAIHINFEQHHQLTLDFLMKLENSITEIVKKIDDLSLKKHHL